MSDELDLQALMDLIDADAPPETPNGVLAAVDGLTKRLSLLDPLHALAVIAGLQTDPAFGANMVRLDMAMRLVRLCSSATGRPTRDKVFRLLNRDMVDCGLHHLEDPPEDFFLTTVATSRGPFRLFQGVWEKAGPFTEDLVSAFGRLPPSSWGAHAFDSAHDLLSLSDLIAFRAGLQGRTAAAGQPGGKLNLPAERQLLSIRGRCLVSWSSLAKLGITADGLSPFFMDTETNADFGDARPGDSDLERRPIAAFAEGIIVVAPHNLSTAARAHLIETAIANDAGGRLRHELLQAQSERITISSFSEMWDVPAQSIEGHPVKQTVWQRSAGRPVHLLQLVDDFEGSPPVNFGGVSESESLDRVASQSIAFVRDIMRKRPDFREGLTIIFLGGWGRAGSLSLPKDDPDWDVIAVEPEDAAAMSLVGSGRPMDLWRLNKQLRRIEAQGFEICGANGWLNLFALWLHTDRTLIPEHQIDFQPPAIFNFPTDLLLEVRQDAARRNERRALPLPNGRFEIVTRLDRDDYFDANKPTYVSTEGIRRGEMLGVVLGHRPVWVRVVPDSVSDRSFDTHETWKAVLHWLEVGMSAFDARYRGEDRSAVLISLEIEWPRDRLGNPVENADIDASIAVELNVSGRTAGVRLSPAWQHGLHRPDNYAELRLAAVLFAVIGALTGTAVAMDDLFAMMCEVVGSDDIRWRHSFVADRPLTLLKAHGMLEPFHEVPLSATALVRCGSTFATRPRVMCSTINGAEECFAFLMAQHGALLQQLCASLRTYDRAQIVQASLSRIVSALAEEEMWTMSARALRAIHGAEKDIERSLKRRNEINAAIRGGLIVAEIAAVEAANDEGLAVGEADLDELMALALLLFQTAELVPPMRAGFMDSQLKISPTGDILHDHSFSRSALAPSVQIRHSEQRAEADKSYRLHFEKAPESAPLPDKYEAAVSAEYHMSFDAYLAFSGACAELAISAGTAILRLSRSALLSALGSLPGFDDFDLGPAIDGLTLDCRANWATLPAGTAASDFDISRFDRHFSLIRRPIIALSEVDDPMLVVSPPMIERAALHNLAGSIHGGLQGKFWSSAEMRKYVGGVAETKGLEFNDRVAEVVRGLGPKAYHSVALSDALRHKGTDLVKRLGDVDVLALSADGRHAWVIEAKDIRFCRTLAETTSRMGEYRGQTDAKGRRDNLRKHLDRVDYVREHREDLAKRYNLPGPPTVHGLVVLDSPQPMAFMPSHTSPDAHFIMLSQLGEVAWTKQ